MAGRRIIFALTWVGCFIFFLAYQQWISWVILMIVTALPWFSLLISLPAMLTAKLENPLPDAVTMGTALMLQPRCLCQLPVLFHKCRATVVHSMTGLRGKLKPGDYLPTSHCGALCCTVTKAGVCDYLGLFRIPLRRPKSQTVLIQPAPLPMAQPVEPELHPEGSWRPKPGGGFAENHELRLYRPGDSVQQIHWKLSAKTGKLILREPMLLQPKPISVGLELWGDADELDRKLGRLLWLSSILAEKKLPFTVYCISAAGIESWNVSTEPELQHAIDAILTRTPTTDQPNPGHWQYRIGGEPDEA